MAPAKSTQKCLTSGADDLYGCLPFTGSMVDGILAVVQIHIIDVFNALIGVTILFGDDEDDSMNLEPEPPIQR